MSAITIKDVSDEVDAIQKKVVEWHKKELGLDGETPGVYQIAPASGISVQTNSWYNSWFSRPPSKMHDGLQREFVVEMCYVYCPLDSLHQEGSIQKDALKLGNSLLDEFVKNISVQNKSGVLVPQAGPRLPLVSARNDFGRWMLCVNLTCTITCIDSFDYTSRKSATVD